MPDPLPHILWDLPDPGSLDETGFRLLRDRIESLVAGILPPAGHEAGGGRKERQP